MITLNVIGLDETIAKLDKLASSELKTELSGILESGAQRFVAGAKRAAPVNFGVLRNEISYEKLGDLNFEVVSNAYYSPYLEWGTITHVNVPGEYADYAAQFKGNGIRKTGGIYPHPYFFPQAPLTEKYLTEAIQSFINGIKL